VNEWFFEVEDFDKFIYSVEVVGVFRFSVNLITEEAENSNDNPNFSGLKKGA